MTDFRVAGNYASQGRQTWLVLCGLVVAMFGVAVFFAYSSSAASQFIRTARWLLLVLVVAVIVGAYFVAARLGLKKFEHDLTFVLTDKMVLRRRQGWPDVQIGLTEIKALYQRPGWLVVESNWPRRTMVIPERVEGFESLRSQLAKYSSIIPQPQDSRLTSIALFGSVLCWCSVLMSKNIGVVIAAGVVALTLLAWQSFRLLTRGRHGPRRLAMTSMIIAIWVTAALLLYLRTIKTF